MLIKARPLDWDIEIRQTPSGIEALAADRAGTGDVMFLHLTMPEMNGYEVLQTLRSEDRNGLVIVASADIQPKARTRGCELGAIAFIQRPVDAQKVEAVLKQYGILV